jgi:hypothetical protein
MKYFLGMALAVEAVAAIASRMANQAVFEEGGFSFRDCFMVGKDFCKSVIFFVFINVNQ